MFLVAQLKLGDRTIIHLLKPVLILKYVIEKMSFTKILTFYILEISSLGCHRTKISPIFRQFLSDWRIEPGSP